MIIYIYLLQVAEILKQRKRKGVTEFLVRWKGYSEDDNTWEPERNLKTAEAAIAAFKSKGKT